ncbi:MAG: hypothetical protein HY698_20505, partial [Deltaproteobacteria bacterium]|nr:hypothetical protein [Deltaproteobacteria bacterium]
VLIDVNGDALPDFVFSAPLSPQRKRAREVRVIYSRGGSAPFAGASVRLHTTTCGVEQTRLLYHNFHNPVSILSCGFLDANGDGFVDFVDEDNRDTIGWHKAGDLSRSRVYLGTGLPGDFTIDRSYLLPGPPTVNRDPPSCGASIATSVDSIQEAGLLDVTGDGVADYVYRGLPHELEIAKIRLRGVAVNSSERTPAWWVLPGTGTGFAPPVRLDTGTAQFQLSLTRKPCEPYGVSTRIRDTLLLATMADLDGDGRPEALRVSDDFTKIHVLKIDGTSGIGAHDSGRLVSLDNGYGGETRIRWGNAKEDTSTPHQVPMAEIVVTSVEEVATRGLGASMAPVRYAYAYPQYGYLPRVDRWAFLGYGRVVTLRGLEQGIWWAGGQVGILGTMEIEDRVRLNEVATAAERIALVGRVRESHVLDGVFLSTNPRVALTYEAATDSRTHRGSATKWNVMPMTQAVASGDWDCSDNSGAGPTGQGFDLCRRSRLVAYAKESFAWEGAKKPTLGVAAQDSIQTHSIVHDVDSHGRVLFVQHKNDLNRPGDDTCIRYAYASSSRNELLVLDALASEVVLDCQTGARLAGTRYRYDHLDEGRADTGLRSHVIQSVYQNQSWIADDTVAVIYRNSYGSPLSTATYNRTERGTVESTESLIWDREFATTIRARTLTADDKSFTTLYEPDPITGNLLSVTSPNGATHKASYDELGRLTQTSVVHDDGQEYLLSEVSYGDLPSDLAGRFVVRRNFEEWTPAGSTDRRSSESKSYYDELGRLRFIESYLGSDYGNRTVVSQYVERDALGRVTFHAEPFQWLDKSSTRYGTTFRYQPDGRLFCAIKAQGVLGYATRWTSPAEDRYPTCFTYEYAQGMLVSKRRGPNENLSGDPRYDLEDAVYHSAVGQLLAKRRLENGRSINNVHFDYDRLGFLSRVIRDPDRGTAVSWWFENDSLGRVVNAWEPGQPKKYFEYDSLGNIQRAHWWDSSSGKRKSVVSEYDGFGRLTKQMQAIDGVVSEEATSNFYYDFRSDSPHQSSVPNLLGRLSWAQNANRATYFSYDRAGHTTTVTHVGEVHQIPFTEHRRFTPHGTLQGIEFDLPDASTTEAITYEYDSAHRLRHVYWLDDVGQAQSRSLVFSASIMDDYGRYRDVLYGNDVTRSWTYRPDRRRELQTDNLVAINGQRLRTYTGLDGEGRLLGQREESYWEGATFQTRVHTYTYDKLNRLERSRITDGVNAIHDEQFYYDGLGNLTKVDDLAGSNDLAFSFDPLDPDRLCQAWNPLREPSPSACDHLYDEHGNTIVADAADEVARSFTYDLAGNVLSITKGSALARFSYDAFGDIAELQVTGSTEGDNRSDRRYGALIEQSRLTKDGATVDVVERKIPGPMGIIARRRGSGPNAVILYQHDDGRGGRYFTDEKGMIVQEVEYDAFGGILRDTGKPGEIKYTKELWNFGDSLRDFGVTQLGPRLYDARLRRFLQRDPLIIPRSASRMNPYAFAGNDPINMGDPTGFDGDEVTRAQPPGPGLERIPPDEEGTYSHFDAKAPDVYQYKGFTYIGHYTHDGKTFFAVYGKAQSTDGTQAVGASQGAQAAAIADAGGAQGSNIPLSPAIAWMARFTGSFIDNLASTVVGILQMIANPVDTAQGIYNAVSHPLETAAALKEAAIGFGNALATGDPEAWGTVAFEVVGALTGAAAAKALDRVGDAARFTKRLDDIPAKVGCFAAGTLVHTAHGLVPIERIEPGTLVWARDEETGQEGYMPVRQVTVTENAPTVIVTTEDAEGSVSRIQATHDHPFYTERGWVSAGNLSTEDLVYSLHSGWLRISGVYLQQDRITVYNFEIEGFHTYFVGDAGAWVHNNPCARGLGRDTVYLRKNVATGEEYVGQAKAGRFEARQAEHAASHPGETFEYHVLEEVDPSTGRSLDVAEEDWIRAGGGPKRFGGPLANERYQMSDKAYQTAGGTIRKPQ